MTAATLESALLLYPSIWELRNNARELIIEQYGRGVNMCARYGNSPADRTAAKAVKLIEFDEQLTAFDLITKWLDRVMEARDRELLLYIWRGLSWNSIARKMRMSKQEVGWRWHQMTNSLIRFVGIVGGGHGTAYANIHGDFQKDA